MKKIIFFLPRMGGGGAERVVANLANEFDKRGNTVTIYTPTNDESFYKLRSSIRIIGENYYISKKRGLRQILLIINGIRLWFAYKKRIEKEQPDVVISFLTETNCIALMHRHKNYKLIVSERNDPTRYNKIEQSIIRLLYKRADKLVCQSACVAQYFGLRNVVVIPNPIDVSILPEYYTGTRRKTICGVGRLMPQKNFSNLIMAFSMLSGQFDEYVLEIYGDGFLKEELCQQIREVGLTKRVKLMGAREDALKRINDSTLFVMSSDYEGYPNALMEAMALGLPVICTDFATGTARELVKKENGILVPINDSEKMKRAIEFLLSHSELRNSMSKENVKIRENLCVEKIADRWMELMLHEQ